MKIQRKHASTNPIDLELGQTGIIAEGPAIGVILLRCSKTPTSPAVVTIGHVDGNAHCNLGEQWAGEGLHKIKIDPVQFTLVEE